VVDIVVDGAWHKDRLVGVAAWCASGPLQSLCDQGFTFICASSSTGVEALAILQALRWAKYKGLRLIKILTNSLEVVQALCCISNASMFIRNVVLDILETMSSFDYVCVVKATQ